MSRPLRWGLLGTGTIASLFAEDLVHCDEGTCAAVASRSSERAEAFAEAHRTEHAFASYDALIASDAVDIVYIGTPHPFHAAQALQCIEAGKPVLVEKPFAMSAAEADKVRRAAQRAGVFAMEAMWTAFIPAVQRALVLVEQQTLGALQTVRADLSVRRPFDAAHRLYDPDLGGGVLLDLGVYAVWWAHRLLGTPASCTVDATCGATGVEEDVTATLSYNKGREAVLTTSFREQGTRLAHATGTNGTLRLHAPWWHGQALSLTGRSVDTETYDHSFAGHGYHFEAQHVHECLREGRTESPVLPLADTVAVLHTLDEMRATIGLEPW
ncbi:MAG: Gfo/Idh/MocA family oxidoreductase [Longimonas sp.]|uniref:Gfo/Idh/MocA family protein n=1 Tax=Longimonas sp. TaxID=2039626 RepID=UPI00334FD2F5